MAVAGPTPFCPGNPCRWSLSPKGPVFKETAALSQTRHLLNEVPIGDDPVVRAEAFLAADAIGALLKLWQLREDDAFLYAAERLIETLLPELDDSEAGALAGAIRQYRNLTGCTRFDRAVLHAAEDGFPYWIETLAVDASRVPPAPPARHWQACGPAFLVRGRHAPASITRFCLGLAG